MQWKIRREAIKANSSSLSPKNSTDSKNAILTLDQALQHLNNAINKNRKIQEAYMIINSSKSSIRSSVIKSIYKDITQNRANSLIFKKNRQKLISQNLEKQQALFRTYRRIIEACITKIASFYEHQSTFFFCSPQNMEIMKLIEGCVNKGKKLSNLQLFSKILLIIFDQNEFLEGRIFQSLLDKGYIISMQQFYKINGLGRQNPDIFIGKQIIEEQQQSQKQNQVHDLQIKPTINPKLSNSKSPRRSITQNRQSDKKLLLRRRKSRCSIVRQSRIQNQNSLKIKQFFGQLINNQKISNFYPDDFQQKCKKQTDKKHYQTIRRNSRLLSLISNVKSISHTNDKVSNHLIDLIQSANNRLNRKYSFIPGRNASANNFQTSLKRTVRRSYVQSFENLYQTSKEYSPLNQQILNTLNQKKLQKQRDPDGYAIINDIGPFLQVQEINLTKKNKKYPTNYSNSTNFKRQQFKRDQQIKSNDKNNLLNLQINNVLNNNKNGQNQQSHDDSIFNNYLISSKLTKQKLLKTYENHQQFHISEMDQQLRQIFRINMVTQYMQNNRNQLNKKNKFKINSKILLNSKRQSKLPNQQKENLNKFKYSQRENEHPFNIQSLLEQLQLQSNFYKNQVEANTLKNQESQINKKGGIVTIDLNQAFESYNSSKYQNTPNLKTYRDKYQKCSNNFNHEQSDKNQFQTMYYEKQNIKDLTKISKIESNKTKHNKRHTVSDRIIGSYQTFDMRRRLIIR